MMNLDTVGVIPFYGGHDSVDKITKDRNLSWLIQTVHSLREHCNRIIVAVCNERDLQALDEVIGIEPCLLSCDPLYLPITACRHIQLLQLKDCMIIYTEADQVFNVTDMAKITDIINSNKNVYVSPHRCVRLSGKEEFGPWERFGHHIPTDDGSHPQHYLFLRERFFHDGFEYVVDNKPHAMLWNNENFAIVVNGQAWNYGFFMHSRVVDGMFYVNTIEGCAYGAAYICHAELFNRVLFVEANEFPLERASGFDIYRTPEVIPLKTLNNQHFWVDHLSHRDGSTSTWADKGTDDG